MTSNPLNHALDAWATTIEAARANTLVSSTAMVEHLNAELKKRYESSFESWKTMVVAGKIDNTNPPQPPAGYELLPPNPDGFVFHGPGSNPVTEPRTDIPADYSKPFVLVLPEPDHVRNVPKNDTMPVGFILTDTSGGRWQKQSSVTPFGVAYFYSRVA
jgi:hypothetical protein